MLTVRRCFVCQKFHRNDCLREVKVQFEFIDKHSNEREKVDMGVACKDCYAKLHKERR